MNVYFVRHGQTDWNVAHRIQSGGAAEVDLNATGVRQAETAAEGLARAGLSFDRIYASPYRRARHTAEIICDRVGGAPVLDDRLREIDFGDYNGTTYGNAGYIDDNIRAAFENPPVFVPHNGETYEQFLARIRGFLDNELKPLEGVCGNVLVVAHRGVLNAVATVLENRDLSLFWKNDTGNCGMDVAELKDGAFTLVCRGRDLGAMVSRETLRPWRLFERRLGMFVHWGVYSVGEVHEQEWMRRGMSKADYEDYARRFTGERFDPDAWIDAAESFGAEYIVLTAKHHDGFCLWDTATTDWCVRNTPFRRDAVGELAAACRRRGMRLGLYYSNPDWHHPNAFNPLSTHQLAAPNPGDVPDMAAYRAYVKAQVTELLTRYGEIACLFWDIPPHIEDPEMNALVRRLQPGIMVNNRGWSDNGDYSTPERDMGDCGSAPARFTEVCDSLDATSWGYNRNAEWHTPDYLEGAIRAARSRGWNFLLNVGPKPDGTIPTEALALLAEVGKRLRERPGTSPADR